MPIRWALVAAATSGALAIGLGAFGVHALSAALDEQALGWFHTAGQYHLLHSVALLVAALAPAAGVPRAPCIVAGTLWLGGIVVFSGSLYVMALLDLPRLGAVTPIGGAALIAGWVALGVAGWRGRGDFR
jgi:uncharacterized membrane protein YgdD (TMEM256/DUF423 family)